jgi:hypothetical protein
MHRILCLLCFMFAACFAAPAQDSTSNYADTAGYQRRVIYPVQPMSILDSVANATALREKFVSDSLALVYVRQPDPLRPNMFVDSILKANAYTGNQYLDIIKNTKGKQGYGHVRPARDGWVLGVIVVLLLFAAALNISSTKDVGNVFQSFYSKRSTAQAGKEDSPISAWTFIGLFLLFGFTFGLFLYLLTTGYYKVYYTISGVQLFVTLSVVITTLFAAKFLVLKFLGFVFDINKLVSEYVSALSLTYFNITFVFLPVALALA